MTFSPDSLRFAFFRQVFHVFFLYDIFGNYHLFDSSLKINSTIFILFKLASSTIKLKNIRFLSSEKSSCFFVEIIFINRVIFQATIPRNNFPIHQKSINKQIKAPKSTSLAKHQKRLPKVDHRGGPCRVLVNFSPEKRA